MHEEQTTFFVRTNRYEYELNSEIETGNPPFGSIICRVLVVLGVYGEQSCKQSLPSIYTSTPATSAQRSRGRTWHHSGNCHRYSLMICAVPEATVKRNEAIIINDASKNNYTKYVAPCAMRRTNANEIKRFLQHGLYRWTALDCSRSFRDGMLILVVPWGILEPHRIDSSRTIVPYSTVLVLVSCQTNTPSVTAV